MLELLKLIWIEIRRGNAPPSDVFSGSVNAVTAGTALPTHPLRSGVSLSVVGAESVSVTNGVDPIGFILSLGTPLFVAVDDSAKLTVFSLSGYSSVVVHWIAS